jgi:16S rRNA (uracil1498-N3)-methyltransferase
VSRFYVPKEAISGGKISIVGKEAHHILDVMRLKVSDQVTVFDGTGKEYTGVVSQTGRKSLSLEITATRDASCSARFSPALIQAITKKDKMDYIIEKATELGVVDVIPIVTGRTIPDWSVSKKAAAAERWRKISLEAAKQCGRADIPGIREITDLAGAVKAVNGYDLKLIAALSDKAVNLKDALKGRRVNRLAIAIGPEGDFTAEEVSLSENNGFRVVGLGPRVLKSDTAGLAALAAINYEYQD